MESGLGRRHTQFRVLFGRQIHHDKAIHPGVAGIAREIFGAVDVDGVVIAHENQRGAVVGFAEVAHLLQDRPQRGPGPQRPQAAGLDRRTIGHGIREGHAELDHIGARSGQAFEKSLGGGRIGIAAGNEGHKASAVFPAQAFETGSDTATLGGPCGFRGLCGRRGGSVMGGSNHSSTSRTLATVKMSLSPRPLKLTTMM